MDITTERRHLRQAVADLASSNWGSVSRRDLRDLGFDAQRVRRAVQSGGLTPAFGHALYAGPMPATLTFEQRAALAMASVGNPTAVSLWSSAIRQNIWHRRCRDMHVNVAGPIPRDVPHGWRFHRVNQLAADDLVVVEGVLCTTPHRTLLDLSRWMTPHQLAAVMREMEYRDELDGERVRWDIARRGHTPGNARLRAADGLFVDGSRGSRGWTEDILIGELGDRGFPEFHVNNPIKLAICGIEADIIFVSQRVKVEIDGRHDTPVQRARDEARDAVLSEHGWRVLRFTPREVRRDIERVAAHIKAVLLAPVVRR